MQFPGKLMNHTSKNDKKYNFGSDFGSFGPNLGPQFFLQVLPLLVIGKCSKLSSYAIYRKTNAPNLKMAKNLILDPILACLTPIWAPNFFWQVSPLIVVRHCSKLSSYAIKGNLMNQT